MIKRRLFEELKSHLQHKEISLIIGPRQAGKTTLMMLLNDFLEKEGEKTLFLNLDIERDKQFFVSQETLIRKIELEIGKEKGYVFIDEIQRKEDAGVFLKGIYDMGLPYKFIVSGSGSVELKEKIHESLVGRKRVFELSTITFLEFVSFRTDYKYENRLPIFFEVERERMKGFLEEYLNFGGYPAVILADDEKEKRKIIGEIYQSYLEKDIFYLLAAEKREIFTNLVRVMAAQVGNLVNFSEIGRTLGISAPTLKDYVWYLEKTFVVRRVTPYFKNLRKEITKSPIFYFYDLGLRNYAVGEFGNAAVSRDAGFVFENFVFNILTEKTLDTATRIHFWRTKDGAEVDFVLDYGKEVIPYEVKYRNLRLPETTRSFKSFVAQYKPAKAFVAHLGEKSETRVNETTVSMIPFYELLKT